MRRAKSKMARSVSLNSFPILQVYLGVYIDKVVCVSNSIFFGTQIHPEWAVALAPVAEMLRGLEAKIQAEISDGTPVLPTPELIMRAFTTPLSAQKVIIVGQDPYPTAGHAVGLSFSVAPQVQPLPRSLNNIYKELYDDLGILPAIHGDLSAWQQQGVLLLNRVLTVRAGQAGSHAGIGWEQVTAAAIKALAANPAPKVAILWGKQAQQLKPLFGNIPVLESAHPSPLSARRGFFGSKPFSRANQLLAEQGAEPVGWGLEF